MSRPEPDGRSRILKGAGFGKENGPRSRACPESSMVASSNWRLSLTGAGRSPHLRSHARSRSGESGPRVAALGVCRSRWSPGSRRVCKENSTSTFMFAAGNQPCRFPRARWLGRGPSPLIPVQLTGPRPWRNWRRELGFSEASEVGAIRSNFVIKDRTVRFGELDAYARSISFGVNRLDRLRRSSRLPFQGGATGGRATLGGRPRTFVEAAGRRGDATTVWP